jgi:hypothetical protein
MQLCFIDWLMRPAPRTPAFNTIKEHLFYKAGCVGLVHEGRQEVVRLRNIMRRVYVVPQFSDPTKQISWLSIFKSEKCPPDYRTLKQQLEEGGEEEAGQLPDADRQAGSNSDAE